MESRFEGIGFSQGRSMIPYYILRTPYTPYSDFGDLRTLEKGGPGTYTCVRDTLYGHMDMEGGRLSHF